MKRRAFLRTVSAGAVASGLGLFRARTREPAPDSDVNCKVSVIGPSGETIQSWRLACRVVAKPDGGVALHHNDLLIEHFGEPVTVARVTAAPIIPGFWPEKHEKTLLELWPPTTLADGDTLTMTFPRGVLELV